MGVINELVWELGAEKTRRITVVVAVNLVCVVVEKIEIDVVNDRVVGGGVSVTLG